MRIGIVAPGRTLPRAAADQLLAVNEEMGNLHEVVIHPACFEEHGHFAGSDAVRAASFLEIANDPGIDAVWFARGGYGACRILPAVLAGLERVARDKLYIGYSDGGFLLSAFCRAGIGRQLHGPMVTDGLRTEGAETTRRVLTFLSGKEHGCTDENLGGPAFAFNLAVLASLVAGPYLPDLEGHTLAIEDVGEHLYAIDRMLFTVFSSGRLEGLGAFRLGRVSEIPENDIRFGENAEEIVLRWCSAYGIPFGGLADIGHDPGNKIVPFPAISPRR